MFLKEKMVMNGKKLYSLLFERFLLGRYLFSGGTAAVVDLGLLFVFTHFFRIKYSFSAILAFMCAVVVSFLMQKFWTFRDERMQSVHVQGLAYVVLAVVNLVANTALVVFFVEKMHAHYLVAQVLAAALLAIVSFFVYRHVIFRGADDKADIT